ncbi:hypothetical protein NDN08_007058 [Rhodosorus marinus]|uniref:DUF1254 domain-containing protein n=1 Tax=Rhodosorus marinus TaxID=101924 RepID=A0AAV8UGX6_9RHOD|nr:hypothetical protein NDN08_007058 [Rhodosorus marinus]
MKSTRTNKAVPCCTVLCAAVVSGLPLLGKELEDAVSARMTQAGEVSSRDKEFMENAMKFTHSGPADPSDASIVSPNVDVVYSTAWLNLEDGPVQLNILDTEGRFFNVQCMHYYQGVFAAPGYTNGETGKQTVVFHHGDAHSFSDHVDCADGPMERTGRH